MKEEIMSTPSSGNVFADLGLPDAEELQAKAEIIGQIYKIREKRGLKQKEMAELMGVSQPKVSALLKGKVEGFTIERLIQLLTRLGCDVKVVISRSRTDTIGHLTVAAH